MLNGYKMKKYSIITILFLLVLLAFATPRVESQKTFQISLPYPESLPFFKTTLNRPYTTHERYIAFILKIDKKGKIKDINAENSEDFRFLRYVEPYLKELQFTPAKIKDKKSDALINISIHIHPKIAAPDFNFPIDSTGTIIDNDLYLKSLKSNNYLLPSIESFPSVFAHFNKDASHLYPFILFRIKTDETGRVEAIEREVSTIPSLDEQIASAILYAKFKPALIKKAPRSSQFLMMVSLFPTNSFPTREWKMENYQSMKLIDKYFIRILPLEVNILSKPIPRRIPADTLGLNLLSQNFAGKISAYITIDSTGTVGRVRLSLSNKKIRDELTELIRNLSFYPGIDRQGKAIDYSGNIDFEIINATNIRINYNWLSFD